MNCRQTERRLLDSFDELTTERESALVAAHLRACPACRRLRDQLLADRVRLRQLPHQLPIGETDAYGRAMQRWMAERSRTDRKRFLWPSLRRAAIPPDRASRMAHREQWPVRSLTRSGALAALLIAALSLGWWKHQQGVSGHPGVIATAPRGGQHEPLRGSNLLTPPNGSAVPITGSSGRSAPGTSLARTEPVPAIRDDARQLPPPSAQGNRIPITANSFSSFTAERPHRLPAGGDLAFMNRDPGDEFRQWVPLRRGEWERIEARVRGSVQVRDEFITIPFPRLASTAERQVAQAVESYKREAAIVDPRLSRNVTCAFKATALSDLCSRIRSDTGIALAAGPSVADEKVTLFCEDMPLREVMRQLSRPFGYTWLRSKKEGGEYRYELMQDLRSQLLEEELRNRDRNAALLDLDREMDRYRPYLSLSPDEALARAASAPPEEKKLLEYLAGKGWGPAQLYARLTPADLAALRAGQKVSFNNAAGPGAQPLPPEMARNVITSLRDYRVVRKGDQFDAAPAKYLPDGLPPSAVPEAQPMVSLSLDRSELGQLTLHGLSGFFIGTPPDCLQLMGDGERDLAVGMSPAVRSPENAVANARFAHDPALAKQVTLSDFGVPPASKSPSDRTSLPAQSGIQHPKSGNEKVTSADVLEAVHRATGLPLVADYYTRLYPVSQLTVRNTRLFEALNRLADTMRLRWSKDADHGAGGWIQFRSADFYDDRLKEVPNRLLFRWAASRREHGALTLDDLVEISQLTDAQLDSSTMAEGARVLYGLEEWDLARRSEMRPHWRFLASLSPEQRQTAQRATGLPIGRMSLAQQQEFLTLLPTQPERLPSLQELSEASLQIDYTAPGEYQWTPPAPESAPALGIPPTPRVRAHTRQAALRAAQQIDPQITDAQITPTEAGLTLTYRLGGSNARFTPFVMRANLHGLLAQLPRPVAP